MLEPLTIQSDKNTEKDDSSPTEQKKPPLSKATHYKKVTLKLNLPETKKVNKCIKDLKLIMWTLAYPLLFKSDIEKKVEDRRKKFEKGKLKKIQELTNFVLEHIKKHCYLPLNNLYKDAKYYTIVNEEKDAKRKISPKDLKKNITLITVNLNFLFIFILRQN